MPSPAGVATDLVALDHALTRPKEQDPIKSEIVEMRFFGGLGNEDIAEILGVSLRTVERYWSYSKAQLVEGGTDTASTNSGRCREHPRTQRHMPSMTMRNPKCGSARVAVSCPR